MKVLISFASQGYEEGIRQLGETAAPYFDRLHLFGESDIDGKFRGENAKLLACPRGYGYWVWKPYFMLKVLRDLAPGDVIFYCDALMHFIDDPAPLFGLCHANGGIMLFNQRTEQHRNYAYTKMDCFRLMSAASDEYFYGDHLNAAFQVYEKSANTISFLETLLHWCRNTSVVSDAPNSTGSNLPGFVDHRHDQSILSILAIKQRLKTFKDISQWGRASHEDPEYGQIVHHHRNPEGCPISGAAPRSQLVAQPPPIGRQSRR